MAIPRPGNRNRTNNQQVNNLRRCRVSSSPIHTGSNESEKSSKDDGSNSEEDCDSASNSKQRRRMVDIHGLSSYLGVCINTIYSWVSQGTIPYIKLGRLLRFDLDKIDLWIAAREREVKSEV